jgi:hypothetical protein
MIHKEDLTPQKKQDIDLLGLKTVASLLETQLSVLFFKRTNIQQEIHRFRIKFNEELGEIVNEILDIRRKMLFDQKDENPDKNAEYNDAKKDFDEYNSNFKKSKEEFQFKLNADEGKLIQKLFRKASKLCHPDIVADEMKQQAAKVFVELNNAYFKNDLDRVKEISEMLENKKFHFIKITEKVTEYQRMEQIVNKLETEITLLKQEIFDMEHSEAYLTIKDIDDWNLHFEKTKRKLQLDLENLKFEYAGR